MLKTSYEPSCYTSSRHVLHMRSAYRSCFNAQACVAQEKGIQELESERAQGSRILPSILSPALSTQPSLVSTKPAGYIDSHMVDEHVSVEGPSSSLWTSVRVHVIVSNKPAGYIDSRMVDELRALGF